jgi:hypothetical protein
LTIGDDKLLYQLPFDAWAAFSKNKFGGKGHRSAEQAAELAAVNHVIYAVASPRKYLLI